MALLLGVNARNMLKKHTTTMIFCKKWTSSHKIKFKTTPSAICKAFIEYALSKAMRRPALFSCSPGNIHPHR
jgi:hypothetical protein